MRNSVLWLTAVTLVTGSMALAGDWPQFGHDAQRTGFTADSPAPPYNVAWTVSFFPEAIYGAQPVIAGGRVFQTTLNGNIYALDLATGERLWHFAAGEPLYSGAAAGTKESAGDGKVFAGCLDGNLYALDAASGKLAWKYDCGTGISGSPCLAENAVFIGNRAGVMFAFTADGKLKWRTPLSWHIYSSPAYHDGRVFVITEDMYVHCLDAKTGKSIWKSEHLYGCLNRDHYPVIHQGKVFVKTVPAQVVHNIQTPVPFGWIGYGTTKEVSDEARKGVAAAMSPGGSGKMPDSVMKAQDIIENDYKEKPWMQSFYALDEKTGKQCYIAVHHYCGGGLEAPIMPPAVCHDGTLMTMCVFPTAIYCRFDPDKNRWVDFLVEWGQWATDNSNYVTVGGKRIFSKGFIGSTSAFDLADRKKQLFKQPNSQLGELERVKHIKRVSVMPMEWSPAEIAQGLGRGGWHNGGTFGPPISGNMFLYFTGDTQGSGCTLLTAYRGGDAK